MSLVGKKKTEMVDVDEIRKEMVVAVNDLAKGSEWFSSKEGFWVWITERIMRQDFRKLSPYGLTYAFNIWRGLDEGERDKFKKQYNSEKRGWLENHT